jgi:transposase
LLPSEESSGERRRLGHINKQGNTLLRFLLVEAAQVAVRSHPQWRSQFFHLAMCRRRQIAKVAMVRKLSILCIPRTVLLLLQALLEYEEVVIVYVGY